MTKAILKGVVGHLRVDWLVLTFLAPRKSLKGLVGGKGPVGGEGKVMNLFASFSELNSVLEKLIIRHC